MKKKKLPMTDKMIKQFNTLHKEVLKIASTFPEDNRETLLFDKWSIRDLLVHITAWNTLNLLHTEQIRDGKQVHWIEDVDSFNDTQIKKQKQSDWNKVLIDFDESGQKIIRLFASLEISIWDKAIDEKHLSTTPRKFLSCIIDHYENEHLPQLKKEFDFLH